LDDCDGDGDGSDGLIMVIVVVGDRRKIIKKNKKIVLMKGLWVRFDIFLIFFFKEIG